MTALARTTRVIWSWLFCADGGLRSPFDLFRVVRAASDLSKVTLLLGDGGHAREAERQARDAIARVEAAGGHEAVESHAWLLLASALRVQARWHEAAAAATRGCGTPDDPVSGWCVVAGWLVQAGRLPAARVVLEEALETEKTGPGLVGAYHLLAVICAELDDLDSAVQWARRALAARVVGGEDGRSARWTLAKLVSELGAADESIRLAAACVEEARSREVDARRDWFHLGQLLHGAQRYDEAVDALRRASTESSDARWWLALGHCLREHSLLPDEAVSVLDRAVEHAADGDPWLEAECRAERGLARLAAADAAGAEADFREGLALVRFEAARAESAPSSDGEALWHRALVGHGVPESIEGRDADQEARLLMGLSWALRDQDQMDAAARGLTDVVERCRRFSVVHGDGLDVEPAAEALLACVLGRLGRSEQAIDVLGPVARPFEDTTAIDGSRLLVASCVGACLGRGEALDWDETVRWLDERGIPRTATVCRACVRPPPSPPPR